MAKKQAKKSSKKPEKKVEVERDKFGAVIGSTASKINAALSKKPRLMKSIVKSAGISGTCYDYLNKMVASKLVIKSKDENGKIRFALAK